MFMADLIKRHGSWLMPLMLNLVIGTGVYLHSMSVKAAIVDELRDYVPRAELEMRENAHAAWAAEATKRVDGKLDDVLKRLERMESKPPPRSYRFKDDP